MTVLRRAFTLALGLAFLLASASPSLAQNQPSVAPNWSYQGQNGPESWASLSADYATCQTGQRQSPINLRRTDSGNRSTLKIEYGTSEATVVNRKRSTQVNTPGGRLTIGSAPYELQQLHVHVPAEHTIRGNGRRAAEIHLVHQSPKTSAIAVLALLVRPGGENNPALSPLVEGVQKRQKRTINSYNVRSLFPEEWRSSYYRYRGSLTTPPCTEGVRWFVLETPIRASQKQLKALRARHEGTNRPLQRRNDRNVVRVTVEE